MRSVGLVLVALLAAGGVPHGGHLQLPLHHPPRHAGARGRTTGDDMNAECARHHPREQSRSRSSFCSDAVTRQRPRFVRSPMMHWTPRRRLP
jgi:hypothetical protein